MVYLFMYLLFAPYLNELVYFLCVVVVVVFVVVGSGVVFKPPMIHGPYEGP